MCQLITMYPLPNLTQTQCSHNYNPLTNTKGISQNFYLKFNPFQTQYNYVSQAGTNKDNYT